MMSEYCARVPAAAAPLLGRVDAGHLVDGQAHHVQEVLFLRVERLPRLDLAHDAPKHGLNAVLQRLAGHQVLRAAVLDRVQAEFDRVAAVRPEAPAVQQLGDDAVVVGVGRNHVDDAPVVVRAAVDDRPGQRHHQFGQLAVARQKRMLLGRLPGDVLVDRDRLLVLGRKVVEVLGQAVRAVMSGRNPVGVEAAIRGKVRADLHGGRVAPAPQPAYEGPAPAGRSSCSGR